MRSAPKLPVSTMTAPAVPLISSVTGTMAGVDITAPDYWRRQLRDAVQFETALVPLASTSCTAFVEIGPGSTLMAVGQPLVGRGGQVWTPSITAVAAGTSSRWAKAWPACGRAAFRSTGRPTNTAAGGIRVPLPSYAFTRERYW